MLLVSKEEIREGLIELISHYINYDDELLEQFIFDYEGFIETIADVIQDYLLHEFELWVDFSTVEVHPEDTFSKTIEYIIDKALHIAEPLN